MQEAKLVIIQETEKYIGEPIHKLTLAGILSSLFNTSNKIVYVVPNQFTFKTQIITFLMKPERFLSLHSTESLFHQNSEASKCSQRECKGISYELNDLLNDTNTYYDEQI